MKLSTEQNNAYIDLTAIPIALPLIGIEGKKKSSQLGSEGYDKECDWQLG